MDKELHFIMPRPQISVDLSEDEHDVIIVVLGVSEDCSKVVRNEVVFPAECAREIGEALLRVAKNGN
ncbi:MAG: hypothetical protein ACTHK2_03890 [Dokdonella sp.]|uniref:hypothetical protein n=1 Tax=Dokdonella sp. TaxID=2291710 RepID=UPI003F80BED7